MVAALAVGDEVVTAGGILGKVTETGDQFLTVELADGVRVKVQRHTIGAVLPKGTLKNA
jgi:preprotein translocase subunit YajC